METSTSSILNPSLPLGPGLNSLGVNVYNGASSKDLSKKWMQSDALSKPKETRFCKRILESSIIKCFVAGLLLLNLVLIWLETDSSSEGEDVSPTMTWTMRAIILCFVVEVGVRLWVEGKSFFQNPANIIDIAVVALDTASEIFSFVLGDLPNFSILRLVRLLRLVKVIRTFTMLRELAFMVHSLGGALRAIFWAALLLFFMLTFCSIVAVHVLHPLNQKVAATGIYEGCERCPRAFKSVMESNLTFLQTLVAGDSWGQVSIPIMEMYPWTIVWFSAMLVSITLGVMNLILACIVDEAMDSRESDRNYQLEQKRKGFMAACKQLMNVWISLDQNGDGHLSREEMKIAFDSNAAFAKAIRALDMRREDIDMLFEMMDGDGSGNVDYEEFILVLYRIEYQSQKTMVTCMRHELCNFLKGIDEQVKSIHHAIGLNHQETIAVLAHTSGTKNGLDMHKLIETETTQETCDVLPQHRVCTESLKFVATFSLDNVLHKLEDRFSALLRELAEEEGAWSSCTPICRNYNVEESMIEAVPAERGASEKTVWYQYVSSTTSDGSQVQAAPDNCKQPPEAGTSELPSTDIGAPLSAPLACKEVYPRPTRQAASL